MNHTIPLIVWLCFFGIGLGIAINKHGEKIETHFLVHLLCLVGNLGLLLWGGFFWHLGWQQILWIIILAFNVGSLLTGPEYVKSSYNFFGTIFWSGLVFWLFWSGGFGH